MFQRAIVERSDEAWSALYAHYRPLLLVWSRQYRMRTPSTDSAEDIADRALMRAWAALSPERFAQFRSLAALLSYLRSCVGATAIDLARAETTRDRAFQKLKLHPVATPEQIVVDTAARAALWRIVARYIETRQERLVVEGSFMLALAPREICERYPDDFIDVEVVYRAKRNLLDRLARCRALHELSAEWWA
jgi:DNA-directed RNA polymerase specialized sigma24 family protein